MTEQVGPPALPQYVPPPAGTHPPLDYAGYRSTALRHPLHTPINLPQRLTEVTGPVLGDRKPTELDGDLIG
jgi:protocatechuate 3,4-dioxygenase beta subunit